jgi:hypothetical protein
LSFALPHFLIGSMREWYWTAPVLCLFYVATKSLLDDDIRGISIVRGFTLGVVALIVIDVANVRHHHADSRLYSTTFLRYVDDHVPANERVFQEDASGFTGYWSRATVINGDGLVNSWEYARRQREGTLAGYLDEEDICFIIRNWPSYGGEVVSVGGLDVGVQDVHLLIEPAEALDVFLTFQFKLYLLKAPRCARLAHLVREPI